MGGSQHALMCMGPIKEAKAVSTTPEYLDLFASFKRSSAGGLLQLQAQYLCLGYIYPLDLSRIDGNHDGASRH